MNMDEEALIARANEEREKLYQRYDRGREPGATIDSWEDPGFEVYHQTDRYGFIHDKRLPQKTDPNEAKAKAIEMERVKKWLKMTTKWDSRKTKEVLRKRIYKGIPDKMRPRVWVKLLNIEKTMADNKNVYQNMLKLARQWSTEARQIDSDVNRQFREHQFYRERYNIKQKSLFNVLTAYSMYNMEVGYCQGMSGVAGVLLMYMDEEEAFWALSTILADKHYAMHGLYIEGFPKLTRFLAHHDKIIAKFIPKLKKHFDQYNLDSILYSLKWFFVIFIERIPFSLCLRVWDIYLLDGERVVTAMAYTILKLHKNKLLKLKDMDLIVQYIQTKLHKDFGYDDDYVIKILEQSMDELHKAKLDLPPPAPSTEFPQKPFGVFVEPNFEAKVGIRKSIFSDTEKQVTDTVILRREQTVQDIAESQISEGAIGGSNSQLNTTGFVPESEDGGSLLGSSRKSLADTSVTSTADLSVFSGGQRSQQAFDICVDDARSMISDGGADNGEGESSPGSAFCSLSIVGRTASAMLITPTPRAMSPQDIVRIYVPPAPPDEKIAQKKSPAESSPPLSTTILTQKQPFSVSTTSLRSNNGRLNGSISGGLNYSSSRDGNFSSSNRNSIISDSGNVTPRRRSLHRSEEELRFSNEMLFGNHYHGGGGGGKSTSSSRRGSLSRKSPSSLMLLENKLMMECSHIQAKRRMSDASNKIKLTISSENVSQSNDLSMVRSVSEPREQPQQYKIMTSFEKLANKQQQDAFNSRTTISKQPVYDDSLNRFTPDEENFSTYSPFSPVMSPIKSNYITDSNIEYKPLNQHDENSSSVGGKTGVTYHKKRTQSISSSNSNDHINAVTTITTTKHQTNINTSLVHSPSYEYENYSSAKDTSKEYSRYYSSHDDRKKSSDDSSSSPKSIVNTPVNETVPLLMSSPTSVNKLSIGYEEDDDDDDRHRYDNSIDHIYDDIKSVKSNIVDIKMKYGTQSPINNATSPISPKPSFSDYNTTYKNNTPISPPVARPSKIPLFHKQMSPVSDLNSVLPPVEISSISASSSNSSSHNRRQRSPSVEMPVKSSFSKRKIPVVGGNGGIVDFDSRIAAPIGGVYEFNRNLHQRMSGTSSVSSMTGANNSSSSTSSTKGTSDLNKIRIKINQNQRN